MESDGPFMQGGLSEARAAATAGEVPIGAVLGHDGKILARSGKRTIRDNDPTAHAEMVVLREPPAFSATIVLLILRSTSPSSLAACVQAASSRPVCRASSTGPMTQK